MLVCCILIFGRLADSPLLHASSASRGNDATALCRRIRMSICREIRALTPEGSEKCLGNVCIGAPLMFKITKEGGPRARKFGHQVLGVCHRPPFLMIHREFL